ncbi:unnamed protein product [Didymodactylos carnosus]|uniref:Rab3 GTPase-activating protein catalytic subunit n=1 Tax=Didymodactylos carnosus TaxID=1234261 RepID=A0A813VK83_9BILA|nr:unnamed protein product [Didymodactylos carnosus]CAF3634563.1 unnamed protein product [Didymodactylos carnosus]
MASYQKKIEDFESVLKCDKIDLVKLKHLAFMELYRGYIKETIIKPGLQTSPTPLEVVDHPLNSGPDSSWAAYFKENEVLLQIDKDVRRLSPDLCFFQRETDYPCKEILNQEPGFESLRKRIVSTTLKVESQLQKRFGTVELKSNESLYGNSNGDDYGEYQLLPDGHEAHWEVVERILFVYCKLNVGQGYVQGMNEIIGPLYYTFATDPHVEWREHAEADCFYCFTNLMVHIRDNFIKVLDNTAYGIVVRMQRFLHLLKRTDSIIHNLFERLKLKPEFYAFHSHTNDSSGCMAASNDFLLLRGLYRIKQEITAKLLTAWLRIEEEIFEIVDYTTASDWERFISRIEEILTEWKLNGPEISNTEVYLSHWYGLREFIVISPKRNNDAVADEDRANLLLSSAAVAVANVGCNVPIFIRVQHEWRNLFVGICEGGGLRTHFNICHLKNVPQQFRNLSGLLEIFKSKLGQHVTTDTVIMVAVRFTYVLKEFEHYQTGNNSLSKDENGLPVLNTLPFGALYDPVSGLHLSCGWPIFSEDIVTESDDYNDFDPLQSQQWAVGVTLIDDLPVLLSECVKEYIQLSTRRETIEQLLGKIQQTEADPLRSITDSIGAQYWTSISSSFVNTTKKLRVTIFDPPLPQILVEKIIEYLFSEPTLKRQNSSVDENPKITERLRQLKSAPPDSFVYRLVVCFACICSSPSYNHLRSIAHIWFDVLQELRSRWENGKLIPCLEPGSPNLSLSKFYQNLQMLNCCTEYRLRHQQQQSERAQQVGANSDDSGEEEFYECDASSIQNLSLSKVNSDELVIQPEGRLKPFGDLKLLKSDEILYIPITQEGAPATEDILDEQTAILSNLGSGEEATLQRAKMQSRSLLSDMESFKAANPSCCLEDFVRWYSPRDWIEMEEIGSDNVVHKKAQLSPRMQLPGNLWLEVWSQAKCVPVRKQKRLFDDVKEAEKILQNLSALSPGELLEQLIPILLHATYDRVASNAEDMGEENASPLLETVYEKAVRIVKGKDDKRKKLQQEFIQCLSLIERHICRFQSFQQKFFTSDLNAHEKIEMTRFISELHTKPEVPVIGGPKSCLGKTIVKMFQSQVNSSSSQTTTSTTSTPNINIKNKFPSPPAGKEYILRASTSRPVNGRSRQSPQRMYAMLTQDEVRIAGAFSEDTTFF